MLLKAVENGDSAEGKAKKKTLSQYLEVRMSDCSGILKIIKL